MSTKDWSGDDFRAMLRALYPRAGWKARNLDANTGRVYDLMGWHDRGAMVEWDWDTGHVSGYIGGKSVYNERCRNERQAHVAMVVVEDELMSQENGKEAQP